MGDTIQLELTGENRMTRVNTLAELHQMVSQVVTNNLYLYLHNGAIIKRKTSEVIDSIDYRHNQICGLYPTSVQSISNDREELAKETL
jgi:hypothetical protein